MTEKTETKLIKKTALHDALSALLADYTVYAPTGEAERQAFTRLNAENLDAANLTGTPDISPKELLFPRSETLYGIDISTGEATAPLFEGQTILFGVRPCDAHGIGNLDSAFLEKGYVDEAYAKRRESLTIITLACATIPHPTCFCDSMGGGPADTECADILLQETKDNESWIASFITEKGKTIENIWQAAGIIAAPGKAAAATPPVCDLKVDKPKELSTKLLAAFEDPAWARFSEACIGCGTCAYICPTCYCFDIDTERHKDSAMEFRCWDCCMFSDYSRMAGGHNPRPTKKERLRNRYLHKLAYFDERYGKTLCVGCGRCILKCPAHLDIASIIEWGGTL